MPKLDRRMRFKNIPMQFLKKATFSATLIGLTIVSIPLYINIYPNKTEYKIEPGKSQVIEDNMSQSTIYYRIKVKSTFNNFDDDLSSLFSGIDFNLVYFDDTLPVKHMALKESGTFSYAVPGKAKLFVQCANREGMTGKCIVTIEEREVFPPEDFAFVPNFADTSRVSIQPGSDQMIFENTTNSSCLVHLLIANYFQVNDKLQSAFFSFEHLTLHIKSPFRDEDVIKKHNAMKYIESGNEKTVTFILPPRFTLNAHTYNKDLKGFAFYQVKAIAY